VLLFQVESHLLAYHLGRPVHTLVEWADLDAHLRGAGPHYVVTRSDCLDDIRAFRPGRVEVLAHSEDVSAVRPHRPLVLLQIRDDTWPKNPPRD
jgi:hypothetical protein